MNRTTVEVALVEFLQSTTGQQALDASTDLLDTGVVDSLMMMDLLVFIENRFQTVIEFGDLTPETFRTASSIAQLINERGNAKKAA